MKNQFTKTVESLFRKDPRLVLLLGDIGVYGFRNTIKKYPTRAFNIGILEQSTIGVAAGLALGGYIPVIHTIAPFLVERALEQIKIDFGYQKLNGNLVSIGASYDYSALGCTHHCPGDVGIMSNVPGSQIIVPGNAHDFNTLFRKIYMKGLNYFRLSEKTHTETVGVNFGKANVIKKGGLATIVAVGPTLSDVIEATKNLDVTILYYTTIQPFDFTTLKKNLKNNKIVTIEPYYKGVIASKIIEKMGDISLSIKTIGVPHEFIHQYGQVSEHDKYCGLDVEGIRRTIQGFLNE